MSWWRRHPATDALRLLPVALLVGVAATQITLAQTRHLSPWLGGGFGMFASVETRVLRHVHVFAHGDGVRTELRVPPELARAEETARAFPTRAHLARLARGVELPPWLTGPVSVEVQVWGAEFDRSTLAPSSRLLRAETFPVDAR